MNGSDMQVNESLVSYKSHLYKEMRQFLCSLSIWAYFIHIFKFWTQKTDHMIYMTFFFLAGLLDIW